MDKGVDLDDNPLEKFLVKDFTEWIDQFLDLSSVEVFSEHLSPDFNGITGQGFQEYTLVYLQKLSDVVEHPLVLYRTTVLVLGLEGYQVT